ncbi:MAG: hypothetical protein II562_00825, partial [Prevotella sp.]|nr:hypothetical protein [Prevotella sp.]
EGQQEGQQSTATSSKVQFFNCRYYHFRDFLNEADTHRSRNKTILSAELQEMIEQLTNGFESGKMIEILSVL